MLSRKILPVLLLACLFLSIISNIQPSEAASLFTINADLEKYNNVGCGAYDSYMDAWYGTGYLAMFPNYVYVTNRRTPTPAPAHPYIFTIYRSFLAFNTSLLAGLKINWVKLWLKRVGFSNIDSSWILKVQNWTDGENGLTTDDYSMWDNVNYDDNKAVLTNWAADGDWNYVKISDPSIITQNGYTYLCLRCNKDVDQLEPTDDISRYAFWWQNNATYLPYLEVKVSGKPLALIPSDSLSLGLPTFFVIIGLVVLVMKSEEKKA